jgi:hypothetical protein
MISCFSYQLADEEVKTLRFQNGISNTGRGDAIERSERAVQVNIAIMRAFVAMRGTLSSDDALARKILEMEQKYDKRFEVVFEAIRQLIAAPPAPARRMGFRPDPQETP